jgi:hypothetical protein
VNNAHLSHDKAVLAFDPSDSSSPAARIADLEAESFQDLSARYRTLVQDIRMISADGRNVWTQRPKRASVAAIGMDGRGRILFLHSRSPQTVHDFINVLLALPLDLKAAMYAEGGPEAQLYVRDGDFELEAIGNYNTGLLPAAANDKAWPVPNVIGIARRR